MCSWHHHDGQIFHGGGTFNDTIIFRYNEQSPIKVPKDLHPFHIFFFASSPCPKHPVVSSSLPPSTQPTTPSPLPRTYPTSPSRAQPSSISQPPTMYPATKSKCTLRNCALPLHGMCSMAQRGRPWRLEIIKRRLL